MENFVDMVLNGKLKQVCRILYGKKLSEMERLIGHYLGQNGFFPSTSIAYNSDTECYAITLTYYVRD